MERPNFAKRAKPNRLCLSASFCLQGGMVQLHRGGLAVAVFPYSQWLCKTFEWCFHTDIIQHRHHSFSINIHDFSLSCPICKSTSTTSPGPQLRKLAVVPMTRMVPAARSEWVDPQLKMSGKHMLQVFFVAAKQVDVRWLMFVCCVVVCSGHVNSKQTSANHNPRRAHYIWVSGSAGGWRCLWCLCQSWKVESSKLPISTRCLKITPPFMVPPHEIKRLIDTPSYLWRDCQQLGQAIGKRFCGELQDPRNQRNWKHNGNTTEIQ